MKLSKLLGAGKSFFGGHETVSYRANKKVYLPKFTSGKNPFVADKTEAAEKPAPVEPRQISVPPMAAPKPVRAVGWADKLNPFRAPEPAAPMPNVQPDLLSLDAVKVLHNDLSDAEVEFVPVKSRNSPPPTGGFMDEAVLKTA